MTRTNLLIDPSFRTLTNWSGVGGASVFRHVNDAVQGSSCLRVRLSSDESPGVQTTTPVEVSGGLSYAASAYVNVPSIPTSPGGSTVVLRIIWKSSTNATISASASVARTVSVSTGWVRLTLVTKAPTDAVRAVFQVVATSVATDDYYFVVDAALFEQSEIVSGWIDSTGGANKTSILNAALTKPSSHPVEGLPLRADVMINDLVLNTIDEDDTLWVCTGIDGWWGQVAPDMVNVPRGNDDGDFDMSGRYNSRIITITGTFFPSDTANLDRARNRLVSAIDLVRKGAWFRTNENPTKSAFVRLNAAPKIETVNAKGKTEFSVTLKAADPLRYGWNDNDLQGYTTITVPDGMTSSLVVKNSGTALVHGVITLYGPIGAGSTITNTRTNQTIRLLDALRGARPVASIVSTYVRDGVATITVPDYPEIEVGDRINVSGAGAPYDTQGSPATVISVSKVAAPFMVSYEVNAPDYPEFVAPEAADVRLAYDDVLEIDTYNKSVTFNGDPYGHRSRIDTMVDWIQFAPGNNVLVFNDTRNELLLTHRGMAGTSGGRLLTQKAHYLSVNDKITINIPETVELESKSLTGNVVTLKTKEPHGYLPGERVDVTITEASEIESKSVASNVVTLTTKTAGSFASGDSIKVTLPTSFRLTNKTASGSEVTFTTDKPHGFATGDVVTVTLPTTAVSVSKARKNNIATLTTAANHNFSVGDRIDITMPSTATVTNKRLTPTAATFTTSAAHQIAVGDTVSITLPTTATPTGGRSIPGDSSLCAVLTTTAAHGFDVGDRITVSLGIPTSRTISARSATTTTATITTATHSYVVGERIQVSGLGARFDGTHTISAVTATTISYSSAGAAVTSGAGTGTVTNLTLRDGYNGEKIIESVTPTTISYFIGTLGQFASSATTGNVAPSIVNTTNQSIGGARQVTAVGSATQFTVARGA